MTQDQWFSNKDLFLMVQELKKGMSELNAELGETRILIRDYNGLRQKINECEAKLVEYHSESAGKESGGKSVWGYVIGAIGIASFVLSLALK